MTRATKVSDVRVSATLLAPVVAAVVTLALVFITPATADWLVMNDGSRIETDGNWSENGGLVIFTDSGGTLSSIRLAEVDLEASRKATSEAEAAASAPPASPPPMARSIYSITDADVEHIDDDEYLADTGVATDATEGEESAAAPDTLVSVAAWDRELSAAGDGVEIRATLENQGEDVAVSIQVNVTLFDEEGEVLATAPASVVSTGLVPGQSTDLFVVFPDIMDFGAVDFDVQHRSLRSGSTSEQETSSASQGELESP